MSQDKPPADPGHPGAELDPSPAARRERIDNHLRSSLDTLYATALHLCGSQPDAEDLVQESALLAFRHFDKFEPGSNFKAWACKILTNCYRSRYRSAARRPKSLNMDAVTELALWDFAAEAGLVAGERDLAETVLDYFDQRAIFAAIDALPEDYRIVAVLYFSQEFNYQEIAEVLDCPLGTVRSRLHRARNALQVLLRGLAEDRGLLGPVGDGETCR